MFVEMFFLTATGTGSPRGRCVFSFSQSLLERAWLRSAQGTDIPWPRPAEWARAEGGQAFSRREAEVCPLKGQLTASKWRSHSLLSYLCNPDMLPRKPRALGAVAAPWPPSSTQHTQGQHSEGHRTSAVPTQALRRSGARRDGPGGKTPLMNKPKRLFLLSGSSGSGH